MATHGSHTIKHSTGAYSMTFTWGVVSQSVLNNTTEIYWQLQFRTHGSTFGMMGGWDNAPYAVMVAGVDYQGTSDFTLGLNRIKVIAEGTQTIKHDDNGTRTFLYSFNTSVPEMDGIGIGTIEFIERKAIITGVDSFTDEENPVLRYSNVAGDTASLLQAAIKGTDGEELVPYRDIPLLESSYTFELTDQERATLRGYVTSGAGTVVEFRLKSVVDGVTYEEFVPRVFSLINYKPTLAPRVVATDLRTKELTGDSAGGTIIKYFSDVAFNTRAAANKGATIEYQTITNGYKTLDDYTSNTGTMENVDSNTFYFSVTDSRGFTTKDAVVFSIDNKKFIEYVKLTNNIKSASLSANGALTFTIGGKYFNKSFGAKSNTMEVEYSVLDSNGDPVFNADESGWVKLGTVSPYVDDKENYTYTYTINGLNYMETYQLSVNVIDELTPVQTSTKVVSAVPIFDWGKEDFNFNIPVKAQKPVIVRNDSTGGLGEHQAGGGIYYETDSGDYADVISVINDTVYINSENTFKGVGAVEIMSPEVMIGGDNLDLIPYGGTLNIAGREYGQNKVLWSGVSHMNGGQTAQLSEAISKQPNGIMLVFSLYRNGAAEDVSINSFFVSKKEVELLPNAPHTFFMAINAGFSTIGAKYLYIDDTVITGNATNTTASSNNGINFSNGSFVLRYVIGV